MTGGVWLCIIVYINKENEMKNAKETTVAKRPTKKQLIAQLEAKGVESKITQSLMRANIETISWVLAKIS